MQDCMSVNPQIITLDCFTVNFFWFVTTFMQLETNGALVEVQSGRLGGHMPTIFKSVNFQ